MDEKLYIRFQETENGGSQKRIGVNRASVTSVSRKSIQEPHYNENQIF